MPGFLNILESYLGTLRSIRFLLCVSLVSLYGCHTVPELVSAPVTGYNHTSAQITRFSINGAGGPSIPPNSGGGAEVCCGVLPVQWNPKVRAIIEWEKDPNPDGPIERDQYGQIKKEALVRHKAVYSHHTETVEIPKYAEKLCALQIHFLPCDQVRVSTTCFVPGHSKYPDKDYFQVEEADKCPAS
ncbi:DUF3304 domain-containing protein [Pseudomonas sp. NPDC089741]|uniref:DUF3304 domain-containing protein n=1 Tax=Pseudomonas sp. NPDC089741 TaxID=3364470 RepID=UPI0038308814